MRKGFPGSTVRAADYHTGEQFRIVIEYHSLPGDRVAGKRVEDMHDPGIGQRNAAGPVWWMTAPEPTNSAAAIMVR